MKEEQVMAVKKKPSRENSEDKVVTINVGDLSSIEKPTCLMSSPSELP